jgi:DNA primase
LARIPDQEIERLKAEVSMQQLAEAQGTKLERHGTDLCGLCPFHEDNSPSLVITPSRNLWNCLGACGGGGSVIDWVKKSKGSFETNVEDARVLQEVTNYYHAALKQSPEDTRSYYSA